VLIRLGDGGSGGGLWSAGKYLGGGVLREEDSERTRVSARRGEMRHHASCIVDVARGRALTATSPAKPAKKKARKSTQNNGNRTREQATPKKKQRAPLEVFLAMPLDILAEVSCDALLFQTRLTYNRLTLTDLHASSPSGPPQPRSHIEALPLPAPLSNGSFNLDDRTPRRKHPFHQGPQRITDRSPSLRRKLYGE
jgi:hypothetical protein